MANTYTTINDVRIMSDGIKALNHALTPLEVISLDVGSDPAAKNDTIRVPLVTARTASSYSNTYESGDTTIVGKAVSLSTHLYNSWHVSEAEAAKTPASTFEMSAVECAYGLAAEIQNTIFNVVTVANFGSTEDTDEETVTAANFDADAFATLRNICVKTLKWREYKPGVWGNVVLDGDYCTNLLKDPAVRDRSASGKDALVSGKVGQLYGLGIYENNALVSSTPGTGENLTGIALQPGALAAAIRPIQPLGSAALEYEDVAIDPDSGVAMSYRRWVNTATGDLWGTFAVLMGAGMVDEARLVAIRSA